MVFWGSGFLAFYWKFLSACLDWNEFQRSNVNHFPLQEGAVVFLEQGKHGGDVGILKKMEGNVAEYESKKSKIETLKKFLFVVGQQKSPELTIVEESSNKKSK